MLFKAEGPLVGKRGPARLLQNLLMMLGGIFMRYRLGIGFYYRFAARDKEVLPPFPFILCSNHSSHLDYIALVEALGISHKHVLAIASSTWHFDNSLRSRVIARLYNMVPIDHRDPVNSLRACMDRCDRFIHDGGKVIIIYPEGTRSRSGRINPFMRGILPIARRTGLPVVPAYIAGGFKVYSYRHIFPRPGRLIVRFGPALPLAAMTAENGGNADSPEQQRDFVKLLEAAIRDLGSEESVR